MKITYISHATLLIEVNGLKIVTDPWVKGSAYCDQWHLFPKALSPDLVKDADVVLYSHGHEDHLHPESLELVNRSASIVYPYSWFGGTKDFFRSFGFSQVKEALNEHTFETGKGVKVTYLSNNLDNVVVIEANNTVLVNINDALPSAPKALIELFIAKIKKRWANIDYVFSSYGGASYFPNTVHYANKNDVEIAETREQFFMSNFCRIASGLAPKMAVPFASDFVLLGDQQRWINQTKYPRYKIKESFNALYPNSSVNIVEAYPDDVFENLSFSKLSKYHEKAKEMLHNIDEDYKTEIENKRKLTYLSPDAFLAFVEKIKAHIVHKAYIIPEPIRKKIKFALKITDARGQKILNVDLRTSAIHFELSETEAKDSHLILEIKSTTLNYSLDNEWGGDALIIGYGAEIYIHSAEAIAFEMENYCVRLLSRYPNTKEHLKREPLRTLRYLMSDSTKRNNVLYRVLGKKEKVLESFDQVLTERDLWLNKSKCDVCKACNL